jgi:hypothetical protein
MRKKGEMVTGFEREGKNNQEKYEGRQRDKGR